jgi:hypothetical protein
MVAKKSVAFYLWMPKTILDIGCKGHGLMLVDVLLNFAIDLKARLNCFIWT